MVSFHVQWKWTSNLYSQLLDFFLSLHPQSFIHCCVRWRHVERFLWTSSDHCFSTMWIQNSVERLRWAGSDCENFLCMKWFRARDQFVSISRWSHGKICENDVDNCQLPNVSRLKTLSVASTSLIKRISFLINKICFHNRNRKNFPRATHESISPKMKLKSLLIELVKCRNWKVARCWHLQSLPRLGKFELARKWDKLPTGKSRDGKLKFSSQFRTWNHFRNIFLNRAAGRSQEKFSNGRKTFANSLCELKLCQKCREFNHREQSPLRILIAKSIMCRTRSNWWNSRKIPIFTFYGVEVTFTSKQSFVIIFQGLM